MSVGNNRKRGQCCAGDYCNNHEWELCLEHVCQECGNTVHCLCAVQNEKDDKLICHLCYYEKKPSSLSNNKPSTTSSKKRSKSIQKSTTKKTSALKKPPTYSQDTPTKSIIQHKENGHESPLYEAITKKFSPWTIDGAGGPEDKNTSMELLVSWLEGGKTPGANFKYWKGGTKSHISKIIADHINSFNVKYKRDSKGVMNQMSYIQHQWGTHHKKISSTGFGVPICFPGGIVSYVNKKYPFYYRLKALFKGRAATDRPASNNMRAAMITGSLPTQHSGNDGDDGNDVEGDVNGDDDDDNDDDDGDDDDDDDDNYVVVEEENSVASHRDNTDNITLEQTTKKAVTKKIKKITKSSGKSGAVEDGANIRKVLSLYQQRLERELSIMNQKDEEIEKLTKEEKKKKSNKTSTSEIWKNISAPFNIETQTNIIGYVSRGGAQRSIL
jgi:hypothetical protein